MKINIFAVVIIFLLSALCYSNTVHSPFVFDDLKNIVENQAIHITELDADSLISAGSNSLLSKRPISYISFALNYYADGLNVAGYHYVNIFIHFLNGLLVYLFARFTFKRIGIKDTHRRSALSGAFGMALLAACIFVTHPLQTQSVTYIVQRMNSLAVLFYLLSMLAYIKSRISNNKLSRYSFATVSIVSALLSFSSKEIAATLPLTIFLYEWYFFQDLSRQWLKKHVITILILTGVLGVISFIYLGGHPIDRILGDYEFRDFTLTQRLLTESRVLIFYLDLIALPLPSRLNLLHNIEISQSITTPTTTLFSLIFLSGILVFAILSAQRYKLISFCLLWYFINLAIESSIIGLELIFEHRLYLPMVCVSLAASYSLQRLLGNRPALFKVVSISLIVAYSIGTFQRNIIWSSNESLWTDVISKHPQSYRAHYNLANALADNGNTHRASQHYEEAIRLKPSYARAHNNYAILLKREGKLAQAIEHYSRAARYNQNDPVAHFNLAILLSEHGNHQLSILAYERAIAIKPDYAKAHFNKGNSLDRIGRLDDAKNAYQLAINADPYFSLAYNNLGVIQARQGELETAITSIRKAINLDAAYPGAYMNLGKIYLLKQDNTRACGLFKKSLSLDNTQRSLAQQIKDVCKLK